MEEAVRRRGVRGRRREGGDGKEAVRGRRWEGGGEREAVRGGELGSVWSRHYPQADPASSHHALTIASESILM